MVVTLSKPFNSADILHHENSGLSLNQNTEMAYVRIATDRLVESDEVSYDIGYVEVLSSVTNIFC